MHKTNKADWLPTEQMIWWETASYLLSFRHPPKHICDCRHTPVRVRKYKNVVKYSIFHRLIWCMLTFTGECRHSPISDFHSNIYTACDNIELVLYYTLLYNFRLLYWAFWRKSILNWPSLYNACMIPMKSLIYHVYFVFPQKIYLYREKITFMQLSVIIF